MISDESRRLDISPTKDTSDTELIPDISEDLNMIPEGSADADLQAQEGIIPRRSTRKRRLPFWCTDSYVYHKT